jgi:hypothetical protein
MRLAQVACGSFFSNLVANCANRRYNEFVMEHSLHEGVPMSKKSAETPKIPNKLLMEAVNTIREDWCRDFFKDRELTPNRIFCCHFDNQDENVLSSYGFTESKAGTNLTYQKVEGIPMCRIRCDDALMSQDRRDLNQNMVRMQTILSFMGNDDNLNARAVVLRALPDGTYIPGDGRHRLVWSEALGCKEVNALVIYCTDDTIWDNLREIFNNMNGAQRTEEERLYLVARKVMAGGQGSIRELCAKNGVSEAKFRVFNKRYEASLAAGREGLRSGTNVPAEVLETAVKIVQSGGSKEDAQVLIDAGAAFPKSRELTKEEIQDALGDLNDDMSSEAIAKAASNLKQEVVKKKNKRGQNKSNKERLMQGIDIALKALRGGHAQDIGMSPAEIVRYKARVEEISKYLT